ncbi:MAG: cupredoxin domain-containing protein [Epsilonproteobacteria bacterium]|nr:cupredoxin domain-containing protein [Campylobacterota bacterium]
MSADQIIVTLLGIALSFLAGWYFWFSERKAVKIKTTDSGGQEAFIKVKGGYSPNLLVFEAGKPIKLTFYREETASCSEKVIFSDFNKKATLTPFKNVTVELNIDKPGEYNFQCEMGMLRGKLIVE